MKEDMQDQGDQPLIDSEDKVTFETEQGDKGPKAVKVSLVN